MTRTIRRGVAPLAFALVVVLVLAWWLNRDKGEPTPFMKPPVVDGAHVDVKYVGSECQDGSRLDVAEASDRVVLTVFAWENARGCSDVGVTYELHATLSDDLGDRELVDGACEMAEFKRYRDCRSVSSSAITRDASSSGPPSRPSPSAAGLPCEAAPDAPAGGRDGRDARLYFYCVNDLMPVAYELPPRGDPLRAVVHAFFNGPTASQRDQGFVGGMSRSARFTVTKDRDRVLIDIDGSSVDLNRIFTNAFPWRPALVKTVRVFTGARQVAVTIDGMTLCSFEPECSG